MQVILMSKHRRWADDGLGGGGIGSCPASDGNGEGGMAGGSGAGIAAEEVAAFGTGRRGDRAGIEDDDIGNIGGSPGIAHTTEQLLHLEALVVVDFTSEGNDRKRWHRRGIVTADQASIFPDAKVFLNPMQLLRYTNIVRRTGERFRWRKPWSFESGTRQHFPQREYEVWQNG